jgi:hypothetical protein
MWKPIPQHEYLKLCDPDFSIISTAIIIVPGKFSSRKMEVIMGKNGIPMFKHTINPAFDIETFQYEEE